MLAVGVDHGAASEAVPYGSTVCDVKRSGGVEGA